VDPYRAKKITQEIYGLGSKPSVVRLGPPNVVAFQKESARDEQGPEKCYTVTGVGARPHIRVKGARKKKLEGGEDQRGKFLLRKKEQGTRERALKR